jgi:hypothetical protein
VAQPRQVVSGPLTTGARVSLTETENPGDLVQDPAMEGRDLAVGRRDARGELEDLTPPTELATCEAAVPGRVPERGSTTT